MPITDLETLKALLAEEGITPNKALGQNFFIDGQLLSSFAEALEAQGRQVLEIGPGPGALTELLLRDAGSLLAVEKDAAMVRILQRRLGGNEGLTVEQGDILRFDYGRLDADFYAAGNLPYYITTPIVEDLLAAGPSRMLLMVQKEAAERFTAGPGDRVYGPTAAMTALLYDCERLMVVPRSCYYPQPEVDSAVVLLKRKPDTRGIDGKRLLTFLHEAFALRRKTLYNCLHRAPWVLPALELSGIDPGIRAEALTPAQLYALYCFKEEALQ